MSYWFYGFTFKPKNSPFRRFCVLDPSGIHFAFPIRDLHRNKGAAFLMYDNFDNTPRCHAREDRRWDYLGWRGRPVVAVLLVVLTANEQLWS